MADIFVSYAHEDWEKVAPFVDLLEDQGWTVWWDREINPGASFSMVIEREINIVKCVIVFWSSHSVLSDWVHAEATSGLDRHILIPIILEPTHIPMVFRQTQTADLSGWPQQTDSAVVKKVLHTISNIISKPVTVNPPESKRPDFSKFLFPALVMLAFIVAGIGFNRIIPQTRTPPMNTVSTQVEPAASIMVLPFSNMSDDISVEVAELISQTPSIHTQLSNHLNSDKNTATYSLQAMQSEEQLLISLYDNSKQQTRINMQIDLQAVPLNEVPHKIANRIALEFNQPIQSERAVVSNEVYMQYLHARSIMRQPPTISTLNDSIRLLVEVVKRAPRFSEAQASLCGAHLARYGNNGSTGDFEEAEKHCFRASRLAGTNPLVNIALGRMHSVAGQLNDAARNYKQALSISPFLTDAISGLAAVEHTKGNMDAAVGLYKNAQHYEPSNWQFYHDLAASYFRRGSYALAIEQWLLAKELVSDQTLVLSDLGAAYFMLEDFDNAILNWKKSLGAEVTFGALSNLGSAYYFQGDYEQALASYKQAIEINKRDYRSWLNAGEAAYHSESDFSAYYRQAIQLAEAQLAVNPDDAEVLSAVALCYASVNEVVLSRQYISHAITTQSEDIYVLYDLAVTHSRLGDRKAMQQTIQKMIRNGYSESLINKDANFST